MAASPKDFLAVATPGAGKTTFALRIAVELMGAGVVEKVTIVCPTEHLKSQWAEAAGTINYEVVTRLGDHIPRIHIRAGRSQ